MGELDRTMAAPNTPVPTLKTMMADLDRRVAASSKSFDGSEILLASLNCYRDGLNRSRAAQQEPLDG